jgi:hypothetical protein
MFAKGIIVTVMGISLVSVTAGAAFAAPVRHPRGVNARERRQTERIKQGVQGHELTRAELDKLRADEAAVRAEERAYRQSGDGLNKRETRDLERDLNQTSHEIYRAKHNHREPPPPAAQ